MVKVRVALNLHVPIKSTALRFTVVTLVVYPVSYEFLLLDDY